MTTRLLKGGFVLTMDDGLGDLDRGDVLIDGDRIAAVGADLGTAADEIEDCVGRIVLPGLIEGHIHLWETPLRGIATESWAGEYGQIVEAPSGRYRPSDVRAATYGGAIELLANGVTTVVDACHAVDSPAHADASIEALHAAGIRALFGYSFRDRPDAEAHAFHGLQGRISDAQRVHEMLAGDSLIGLAIALNDLTRVDPATTTAELRCARDLGVTATIHSTKPWEISALASRGELGPDLQWVHCTTAPDEELEILAEHGGAIAVTPEIEVGYEGLYPLTGRAVRYGVPVTLGDHGVAITAANPLMQMRVTLQFQRKLDAQVDHLQGRTPKRSRDMPSLTSRQVLELGTAGAARALGLGDRTGSLTPGKQADVLVLGTGPYGLCANDPVTYVVQVADRRHVERVYVAGRERVRDGRLVDVDEARIRAELDATRAHVVPTARTVTR